MPGCSLWCDNQARCCPPLTSIHAWQVVKWNLTHLACRFAWTEREPWRCRVRWGGEEGLWSHACNLIRFFHLLFWFHCDRPTPRPAYWIKDSSILGCPRRSPVSTTCCCLSVCLCAGESWMRPLIRSFVRWMTDVATLPRTKWCM